MRRSYGYIKQPIDERDLRYSAAKPIAGLPSVSNLNHQLPDCWDQLSSSSCTAHGIAAPLWSGQVIAGITPVMPSRLFMYFNEREREGSAGEDSGAIIRDGIKVCNVNGIANESTWPFDISKILVKPTQEVYDAALLNRIHFYAGVDLGNLDQVKLALSHKLPVVFGFQVFDYFESSNMANNGILNMPKLKERLLGGHCVAIVGHDDSKGMFLIRNSWGIDWNRKMRGDFWMSYEYMQSSLVSDGWVIRLKYKL